eukprot:ctg_195.g132
MHQQPDHRDVRAGGGRFRGLGGGGRPVARDEAVRHRRSARGAEQRQAETGQRAHHRVQARRRSGLHVEDEGIAAAAERGEPDGAGVSIHPAGRSAGRCREPGGAARHQRDAVARHGDPVSGAVRQGGRVCGSLQVHRADPARLHRAHHAAASAGRRRDRSGAAERGGEGVAAAAGGQERQTPQQASSAAAG